MESNSIESKFTIRIRGLSKLNLLRRTLTGIGFSVVFEEGCIVRLSINLLVETGQHEIAQTSAYDLLHLHR